MTDSNETKTVTSRTPSHFAYNVRNREGGDNYWIRIGSAWAHADGNGFNIQLETIPLDGRVALRITTGEKMLNLSGLLCPPFFLSPSRSPLSFLRQILVNRRRPG